MSTDLRDALDALAHDVPDLGDVEVAIARHRLRRRRQALAVGAAAAAAVVAAALTGVPGLPSAAPAPPADHRPPDRDRLVLPRVQRLDLARPAEQTVAEAPLPDGAALAGVLDNAGVVVVNGREVRRVTNQRGVGRLALSPDGRFVSWSDVPYGYDEATVLDVTTGNVVFHRQVPDTSRRDIMWVLHWSGDGHLVVESGPADGSPPTRVRVWTVAGDEFHPAGPWLRLPGRLIGIDEHAERFAAEDRGQIVMTDPGGTHWRDTGVPVTPPGHDPDPLTTLVALSTGTGQWNGPGPTLGWLTPAPESAGADAPPEARWVDLSSGTWAARQVAGAVVFLGWRDARPLLLRSTGPGRAEVVAVAAQGPVQVLVSLRSTGEEVTGVAVALDATESNLRASP